MSSRSLISEKTKRRSLDHLIARCVFRRLECHFLHNVGATVLVHYGISQREQTKPSSFALPEPTKTPIELTCLSSGECTHYGSVGFTRGHGQSGGKLRYHRFGFLQIARRFQFGGPALRKRKRNDTPAIRLAYSSEERSMSRSTSEQSEGQHIAEDSDSTLL